jgi:predicted transcriptional regulator of viral defense system
MPDNLIVQLARLKQTIFTSKELALIWRENNPHRLKNKIHYYLKNHTLTRLTRGVYHLGSNYNPLELATHIYSPSYLSFETILLQAGIIFQHYDTIFVASPWSKTVIINNQRFIFHQLKTILLYNQKGIIKKSHYRLASPERALLDTLYLYPHYHFDNLRSINFTKCRQLLPIYHNQELITRFENYAQQK